MKFTVVGPTFKAALARIESVIERKATLPVLSTVKVEAEGSSLHLTATNIETWATITIEADIAEPGAACVPGAELTKLVGLARKSPVSVSTTENVAEVTFAQSSAHLSLWPIGDFPSATAGIDVRPIDGAVIADALRFCLPAVDPNSVKSSLQGVLMQDSGGSAFIVGTDGRRIHYAEIPGVSFGSDAIIMGRDAQRILSLAEVDGPFSMGVTPSGWAVEAHGCRIWGRVIDDVFPDWKRIIAGDRTHVATVDADDLTAAIGVATVGADMMGKAMPLVIDAAGDILTVRGMRPGPAMTKCASASIAADVHSPVTMAFALAAVGPAVAGASEDSIAIFSHQFGIDIEPAAHRIDLKICARVAQLRSSEAEMAA